MTPATVEKQIEAGGLSFTQPLYELFGYDLGNRVAQPDELHGTHDQTDDAGEVGDGDAVLVVPVDEHGELPALVDRQPGEREQQQ